MKKLIGALWILAIALVATFFLSSGPSETQEFKLEYKDTAVAPATPVIVSVGVIPSIVSPVATASASKSAVDVTPAALPVGIATAPVSPVSSTVAMAQPASKPAPSQSPSNTTAPASATPAKKRLIVASEASDERLKAASVKTGWSFEHAKGIALNDSSLHLTADDRFIFICKMFDPAMAPEKVSAVAPQTSTFTVTPPVVTAASVFQLHSRPGAARVLYLDFNGHSIPANVGYLWDFTVPYVTPAFQLAGTSTVLDQRNLNVIRDIWLRVSDDFSAWDIDVTTEQPLPTAQGQRCVIGGSSVDFFLALDGSDGTYVGGVASPYSFGGAFYDTAPTSAYLDGNDSPNFVFIDFGLKSISPTTTNNAIIAACVSHEVGHTLGLAHWGESKALGAKSDKGYTTGHTVTGLTGVTTTCAIMGNSGLVGWPNACMLNQWSRGDYPYAKAATSDGTQDDIAVISLLASPLTSVGLDDHGDTLLTATSLGNANTITLDGVIASSGDVDLIKIVAAKGMLTVGGVVSYSRPDLKLGISLLNSSGVALAKSYTTSVMGNSVAYSIPSTGTYYIKVNGVGYDPAVSASAQVWTNTGITGTVVGTSAGFTNYGSIGRYSLSGTWTAIANNAPVAIITSDSNGGKAPITIGFSGTSSTDSDGIVSSWVWNFGDTLSSNNTSTLATPSHTYIAPGTYTVTLQVKDNAGASSLVASKIITTTGVLPAEVKIASITPVWTVANSYQGVLSADIALVDQYGQPLRNVLVYVTVSGLVNGKASAKSDTYGHVYISCPKIANTATGTVTFTVTSLVLKGYPWLTTHDTGNPCVLTR